VGETALETKREIDETRAHLGETLQALQQRTRRSLDVKTQLQSNRQVQVSLAGLGVAIAGLVTVAVLRRQRRSGADRLLRKLKLNAVRQRLGDLGEDARAWSAAQKRLVRASSKSEEAELERRQRIARRLIVRPPRRRSPRSLRVTRRNLSTAPPARSSPMAKDATRPSYPNG